MFCVEDDAGKDFDPCYETNFGSTFLRYRTNNPCGGESCFNGKEGEYTCKCRAPFIPALSSQNKSTCVYGKSGLVVLSATN